MIPPLTPEIVPQIAKRAAPVDLREFQGELYRMQRAVRTVNRAAVLRKSAARRFRMRVRPLFLHECKVLDTLTDSKGTRYLKLENGMNVRVDHVATKKNQNAPKISNPVVSKLIISELKRATNAGAKLAA